jgi:hypothetical protein
MKHIETPETVEICVNDTWYKIRQKDILTETADQRMDEEYLKKVCISCWSVKEFEWRFGPARVLCPWQVSTTRRGQ